MTTNSCGSALPRFDFPKPSAPKFTARAARSLPTAAIMATAAATYYATYFVLKQQYTSTTNQHNQAVQSLKDLKDRENNTQIRSDEMARQETLWWTAF
ncbi:hypothetical protein FSARC_10485 [Fusarium sarcochroum]|uniref:Uncharacterized protein n=1 Tax=Fusarium sarcochroum TaxID=1208366 RepID=A0A8H4X3V0_9HYPO|nr:hypothetical protein FSARC_10485 [Fusarium sarcochroum]